MSTAGSGHSNRDSPFRQSVAGATVIQLGLELGCLIGASLLALSYHGRLPPLDAFGPALLFAIVLVCLNGAVGLYQRDRGLPFGEYLLRQLVALLVGFALAYLSARALPGGAFFQQALASTFLFALCALVLLRQCVLTRATWMLLPHRVLVLGTGPEARIVDVSLSVAKIPGLQLVGFYPLDKISDRSIVAGRILSNKLSLEDTVKRLGVEEIIVAVREQRGGVLPLRALLDCRLHGIPVTDLPRFFERVHGRVPIESLKASWLIYGEGFRQTWLRAFAKRIFDVFVSTSLLVLAAPIMAVTAIVIFLDDGRPIFYRQERVGHHGRIFTVLKFRSMKRDAEKDGNAYWATPNDSRVTNIGRLLRRTRIDELPQLINVVKGDMSLVGPRPERPQFVALLTEQVPFYAVRQSVKPGITGWAQVRYTYGGNVEESIKKLEYDLYYVKNHSLLLDALILLKTVKVVLLGEGAR